MPVTLKAPDTVQTIINDVKNFHHSPRLDEARVTAAFVDSKPFTNNRFNWGSTKKFSEFSKVWQATKYDFCIVICSDIWHQILGPDQKHAFIDLHMTRMEAEFLPEVVVENGKKKVQKDEFGRVQYSNELKIDDDGNPKWKVSPLDLLVFTQNVSRYGLWCEELLELNDAIIDNDKSNGEEQA